MKNTARLCLRPILFISIAIFRITLLRSIGTVLKILDRRCGGFLLMLVLNVILSDLPLDMSICFHMLRDDDVVLIEVIRLRHPQDSHDVQENDPDEVADELE